MGAILNNTAFEWQITVTSHEVDQFNRLKLSALMKLQQEIGERHLNVFGTKSDDLRKEQKVAFIFTKMNILVHRLPKAYEKVMLRTWCSELKGVRFTRNYVLFDELGQRLTEAKAEVTAINLDTRRLVRPKEIHGFEGFLYNDEQENGAQYPQKISVLSADGPMFERKVVTSDIDDNGHVNNTVYVDMATDCLSKEVLTADIKGFEINFKNEVFLSEVINITVEDIADGYAFCGKVADKECFTALLKM